MLTEGNLYFVVCLSYNLVASDIDEYIRVQDYIIPNSIYVTYHKKT